MNYRYFLIPFLLIASICLVTACADPTLIPTQTHQQQSQEQSQSMSVIQTVDVDIPKSLKVLDVGQVETISRLLYPEEVIIVPANRGDRCSVISASPVALYVISPMNGDGEAMVQGIDAQPVYDPYFHRLEFGRVVVKERVPYWTTKASLSVSSPSFCVVDNRAPGNDFTMVEFSNTLHRSEL